MTGNTGYFKVYGRQGVKLRTPQLIYARSIFIYSLFYTVAFSLGCVLFHLLDTKESEMINSRISAYFSTTFSDCKTVFDFATKLLAISQQDLSGIFVIFCAGFTMLCGIVISMFLLFRGFSMGFSLSYFVYAIRSNAIALAHPAAAMVLFSVMNAAFAVIIIHLGVKTTIFSDEFKALGGRPRKIIRSKALYMQIFRFLIAFGAILILNLIRCVL